MGQNNSKLTNLSEISITSSEYNESEIPKFIWKSKNMTFALGQKTNIIGHTTIVVIFDGIPKFTIDFGTFRNTQVKAALSYKAPSTVNINSYNANVVEIKFIMESFDLEDDFRKDIAANLIDVLRSIPTQHYDLIEYNCRDYVTAAVLVIYVFAAQDWEKFDWDCVDPVVLQDVAAAYLMTEEEDEIMTYLRDVKQSDWVKLKKWVKGLGGAIAAAGAALTTSGSIVAGLAISGTIAFTAGIGFTAGGAVVAGIAFILAALGLCAPCLCKLAKNCLPQIEMKK